MIISPLGDVLMKTLHISTSQFGFIVSSYAFSAGASGILAAGFADKFDRKKILLFFYAGFILGTLMCGIANNYYTLLFARIITGLFGGVIGSISLAIVADLFAINQRGRVMGMVQMAFAGSQIIGIPAGIFVANHYGWHATFLMIVIITILIFLAIALKLSPITEHLKIKSDKNPFLHLWHTLTNPRHQTGFLATAFLAIGGFMLMPFSSSFLVNNVHISQKQLPLVFMFTGISSIIIMPLIGKLSDKFNKFILFAIGSVIAVLMVVIYTNMHIVPLWQVIVVNMLLFMGIMSRIIPATTLNTSIPEMQNRGAFMSITSSLQQIAGGLSAILAGFIVHQQSTTTPLEHFDTLGYLVAILILVSIWFVYRVNKMITDKK
jgi:predicted MFS family arabinose efflux permease